MLARQPLNLLPLIKEQVRLLQRTLPETITVALDYDAASEGYTVDADPTRIQQVIMNLAVNARDAMPNGGTLQLALQHRHYDHHADVPLPQMEPGDWVALSVADSGSGIAPEALAHLFEPFYTTKGPGQGSGLGLAQVHGIVAQHEGHIDVQTESGIGATFTIYLPASAKAQQEVTDDLISAAPLGQGQRVLVVEDNALLRTALCETLADSGYQIAEAANGAEALAIIEGDSEMSDIDLILSDVVMPQMGGVALAHALRERGIAIPVILMSGHPRQRNLDELRAQGVADWLPKPPDLDHLVRAVAAALRSRT
jgi:two-component system, cell cycle sensor histidine kinase and response regulator CckA